MSVSLLRCHSSPTHTHTHACVHTHTGSDNSIMLCMTRADVGVLVSTMVTQADTWL